MACYAKKALAKSRRMERDRYIIEDEERKQREAREQEMERREFEERLGNEQDDDSRYIRENNFDEIRDQLIGSRQQSSNKDENQYAWVRVFLFKATRLFLD